MSITIIHLTDIHFTTKTDISYKTEPLCRAIIKDARGSAVIYFILSGDIAYSGKKAEYELARKFISVIGQLIRASLPDIILKFIIVPGNHDCDFDGKGNQVRRIVSTNMSYNSIGNDSSVVESCLGVQEEFWKFYKIYNNVPSDKLYYTITDNVNGTDIRFHCINTAWISQREETVGDLFFPVQHYAKNMVTSRGINIGVWHHPYNWFNPNTRDNNKKEFEKFTEKIAQVHFFGHEHEQSYQQSSNRNTGKTINLLSGRLFHDDKKPALSGFQSIVLDHLTGTGAVTKYNLSGGSYCEVDQKDIDFTRESPRSFIIKQSFAAKLDEMKLPLVISNRKHVKLSHLFVYPDMESSIGESKVFDNYLNSSRIFDTDFDYCVLNGENQVGKTSLISMVYLKMYETGIVPVMLQGQDLRDDNLKKYVRQAFKAQYDAGDKEYDRFEQLEPSRKLLLIDDYQESKLNSETTSRIIAIAKLQFGKAIFVMGAEQMISPAIRAELHDMNIYRILPLGYKRRNELIEKYLYLKQNPFTVNDSVFIDQVKITFDNVQIILGDRLMPSYPIYILSILQALEYKPLKQNETSLGYCYQTLIHYSLNKCGVSNDDLDAYFNFLTELAYNFVSEDLECLPRGKLNRFYFDYAESFICPPYEFLIHTLKKANILTEDNDGIQFGYNYILYYLSAKKIADILHTGEGRRIVTDLFDKMYNERNASILVFITHHSKDISFIEESLLNSMMVFDTYDPVTIERNDPFAIQIEEFAANLKQVIIDGNRTPRQDRDRMLVTQDKRQLAYERTKKAIEEEYLEEFNEVIRPFLCSLRSIEIVGQIIRNRKGSLPKTQLVQMITELYATGFRTINYLGVMLDESREDIINMVNEETEGRMNPNEVEKRVNRFIQIMSFECCISIFTRLMHSVGNKELKQLYNEVARNMNTPAAKLVSFGINSYYGTISYEDVRKLAEEFKDNHVALRLLRGRVRTYVYQRNPDFKTKQRFANLLNMTITPLNPMM